VRGACANGGGESSILRWGKVPPVVAAGAVRAGDDCDVVSE
jgi:hypothetical protein